MYNDAEMRLGMIMMNGRMLELGAFEYKEKDGKRCYELAKRPEEPGPYQDYYDYVKLKGQDVIWID